MDILLPLNIYKYTKSAKRCHIFHRKEKLTDDIYSALLI